MVIDLDNPGEHVRVLRNGQKDDDPIVHVKNLNGDRGRQFLRAAKLKPPPGLTVHAREVQDTDAHHGTTDEFRERPNKAKKQADAEMEAQEEVDKLQELKSAGIGKHHEYLMALGNVSRTALDEHKRRYMPQTHSAIQHWTPGKIGSSAVYAVADRVLDLAAAALAGTPGENAIRHRTPYFGDEQNIALWYSPEATLFRHVDGVGGWLTLFSLGNTVRFYVGDETVDFESGDALVFKGASVMHGVDQTLDHATYGGERCPLPTDMENIIGNHRVSVQARQQ